MSFFQHRSVPHAMRALRHHDFRVFFLGQSASLIGTWMQRVAVAWLIYRLTGSALMLGLVAFASAFPTALMAPLGGALADRWSRLHIVLAMQLLAGAQAVLLAALVLTGAVQVWHVIGLTVGLALVNGLEIPARQSLLVALIKGPGDLANAIALNSSAFNGARLVGPAVAGIMIGLAGEGWVFALNAATYAPLVAALLALRAPEQPRVADRPPLLRTLADGVDYAWRFPPIRAALLLLALVNFAGMPYMTLLPVFATDVLAGGSHTYGFLMAATGLGAVAGAAYLAGRRTIVGLGRVIAAGAAGLGLALIAFSQSRAESLSLLLLCAAGFGMMVQSASINTVLQTVVDDRMRGRLMSLYTMVVLGMAPLGNLAAGALASRIGAPATVLLGGMACIAAGAWFARQLPVLRARMRPVYVELGILEPDGAEAAQGLAGGALKPAGGIRSPAA